MCDEGEAPAGGLAGATGAVGAVGELGAGCDGGGMGLGLGDGCCARRGSAINTISANAPHAIGALVTAVAKILLAMISSPGSLLTDY